MTWHPRVLILLAWLGTANTVLARGDDAVAPPPDPLQGPSVDKTSNAGPTIVERSFEGTLRRLDVRPEEAAVRKLDLSEDEKARVETVLQARSAAMDQVVRDHIDLLVRISTAKAADNKPEIQKSTQELREALRPLTTKGSLQDQLAGVLENGHAQKMRDMVREFYRALISEGMKQRPSGDPLPTDDDMTATGGDKGAAARKATLTRVIQDVYGQEIRRSYERIAAEGQARLEELVKRLELTPEQEEKVRAIALDVAQKTKLKPTPAQRVEEFSRIAQELTPEQRKRLVEMVGEKQMGGKKPMDENTPAPK